MVGLTVATVVVYLVFLCCCKLPRCMARIFYLSGLAKLIIGTLMATVLMPECPMESGPHVCSMYKYNPGPFGGIVFISIGIVWCCKACSLQRVAKKQEMLEEEAEKAALEMDIEAPEIVFDYF